MFSYKKLMFILLALVFALLLPWWSDMSAESIKYMLVGSVIFLFVLYYLYRQWRLDEEKMTEKIAQKWEEKEHEVLHGKRLTEEDEYQNQEILGQGENTWEEK